ncbi:ABC transporter ATP-binding protein [Leucobacter sp. CSA2]|uniref:ABC transporter ATP-binding protein n=1 Tax=Leucobacter edaphi TaxID=2796472 RepID=A0A934QC43_9MICO|nr:ABC transporter ATP-binding protein [Leucobacter edaphi]MBK0421718.1 ABC transporter ATP-binding protein [Leucobacter edaphi]
MVEDDTNRGDAASGAPAVSVQSVTKQFGDFTAVDGLSLDIRPGEFFSMLGPSGSGKTTVLRLIAGFEQPTEGTISLFGDDVTKKAPFDRNVNTVFQDYALFPHMSVLDNVGYGLRVRGVGRADRKKRAMRALESVRLDHVADRMPSQLSGGQRQRVALARATVVEPSVLLLDEPLGALDLKLREQMQVELKQLQRDLGITFIFVTHDQEEALTLSDRIAVFNAGKIEQLGTPRDLYENPASRFVADFIGNTNLLDAEVSHTVLGVAGDHSIRPEKMIVSRSEDAALGVRSAAGSVVESIYLGNSTRVVVDLDAGVRVTVLEQNVRKHTPEDARGERVFVQWHDEDVVPLQPAA